MSDRVNCPPGLARPIRGWRVPAVLINRVVRLAFPPLSCYRSLFDLLYRFRIETIIVMDGRHIISYLHFIKAGLCLANYKLFSGSA